MEAQINQDQGWPLDSQAFAGTIAAMDGAVVHHPEHASRRLVGLAAHDLSGEGIEGLIRRTVGLALHIRTIINGQVY